jgi:hypothetical protein
MMVIRHRRRALRYRETSTLLVGEIHSPVCESVKKSSSREVAAREAGEERECACNLIVAEAQCMPLEAWQK